MVATAVAALVVVEMLQLFAGKLLAAPEAYRYGLLLLLE